MKKHICPFVQTSGDDVGALPKGGNFTEAWLLVFYDIKRNNEVLEKESAWMDLLVKVEVGTCFVCFIVLQGISIVFIEVLPKKVVVF